MNTANPHLPMFQLDFCRLHFSSRLVLSPSHKNQPSIGYNTFYYCESEHMYVWIHSTRICHI